MAGFADHCNPLDKFETDEDNAAGECNAGPCDHAKGANGMIIEIQDIYDPP